MSDAKLEKFYKLDLYTAGADAYLYKEHIKHMDTIQAMYVVATLKHIAQRITEAVIRQIGNDRTSLLELYQIENLRIYEENLELLHAKMREEKSMLAEKAIESAKQYTREQNKDLFGTDE